MLDEVLAFLAGTITATVKIKNPSPKTYGIGFMIGFFGMIGGVFLAWVLSMGFLPAMQLIRENALSAAVIVPPLVGGVLGACFVSTLSSRRGE